jgi:hypothetical protein
MSAAEAIEQAFLQLTFAIKLMTYREMGKIRKEDFDTNLQVNLKKRNLSFPANSFRSSDDLILAAQNNYVITLGFTALVLDRALNKAGFANDLPMGSPHRDLRALVYMIRCAFAHDMMHPVWHARGPAFARTLQIDLPSGSVPINMAALNDKPFSDGDIGGIETYFEIRRAVERIVTIPS